MIEEYSAQVPILGKLKKGAPQETVKKDGREEKRVGKNQDFFRFVPSKRFQHIGNKFKEIYGDTPRTINIFLPYPTLQENYDEWMEEYGQSKQGKSYLKRRCTTKQIVRHLPEDSSYFSNEPIPCKAPQCKCRRVGRLNVYIVEFFILGYTFPVTVETHSVNDMTHIKGVLTSTEVFLSQVNKSLCGARFLLERAQEKIGVPMFDKDWKMVPGMRSEREEWLLNLRPDPAWQQKLMREQYERSLAGGSTPLLLLPQDIKQLPPAPLPATHAQLQASLPAARVEVVEDDEEDGVVDRDGLMARIDGEMMRSGTTVQAARQYLSAQYQKNSRMLLSNDELQEFLLYLSGLPDLKIAEIVPEEEALDEDAQMIRYLQQGK